jgi:PEGA domain
MMRVGTVVRFSLILVSLTGCGTIMNGTHQDLAITSHPGGATVIVDGQEMGTTPIVASIWRKHAHVVKLERPGFYPVEHSVVPEPSGWAWGNIVFAGLVGLMVDAWTGGLYELSQVHVAGTFPASFEKKVETPTPTAMSSR